MIHPARIHTWNISGNTSPNVVYWMSRDQRVADNFALLHAASLALKKSSNLAVVFCLVPQFQGASLRQYDFMLKGLREVAMKLEEHGIPFYLLEGDPARQLTGFINAMNVGTVVTDFDPLRIKLQWREDLLKHVWVDLLEVDTHNIVPARFVSNKQEFGAYTIRPKIKRLLPEFLHEFPALPVFESTGPFFPVPVEWDKTLDDIAPDQTVGIVTSITPGEDAALCGLEDFLENRLMGYAVNRNDPNLDALSNLSAWFHFGHLSPQRAALETLKKAKGNPDAEAFLEEMIIRRELSDNYCLYNKDYDNLRGIPAWARETLERHRKDEREFIYSVSEFEKAGTHDPLWNAAQMEMVTTGKMHGYMRMYWAKKILEWTPDPETALSTAIYLNDRYQLDGRDPNGYTGCAWSIAGVHDRAWAERPVYGKIRYMNYKGAKRKFDVERYIKKWIRQDGMLEGKP